MGTAMDSVRSRSAAAVDSGSASNSLRNETRSRGGRLSSVHRRPYRERPAAVGSSVIACTRARQASPGTCGPSAGNGILDQIFRTFAAVSPNIILRCRELKRSSSTTSTGRL
jgi:hypothetical protein